MAVNFPYSYTGNNGPSYGDDSGGDSSIDPSSPYYTPSGEVTRTITRPGVGTQLGPNSRYRPSNPNLPANVGQPWIDTQTGQTINGQLATDGKTIITGFSRGNMQNTTGYDVNTGKKSEAMPHPWLDAAKNAALIMGGPELAGAGMALAAGGAGAAGGGAGGAAATGIAPSAATIAAGTGTGVGTGAGVGSGLTLSHLAVPMITGAATNAARTKLAGGSWGQALESGAVGAGTAGLGGAMGGGASGAIERAALNYGSGALQNAIANQGRSSSNSGIGPSSGMAQGFQYGANNPNIADALAAGQAAGIANQPFRAGYQVNYPGVAPSGSNPGIAPSSAFMPPIYSAQDFRRTSQAVPR